MVAAMQLKIKYCHDKLFTRLIIEIFKYYEKTFDEEWKFWKKLRTSGGGGSANSDTPGRGKGVDKGQIFADVLYGCPHRRGTFVQNQNSYSSLPTGRAMTLKREFIIEIIIFCPIKETFTCALWSCDNGRLLKYDDNYWTYNLFQLMTA